MNMVSKQAENLQTLGKELKWATHDYASATSDRDAYAARVVILAKTKSIDEALRVTIPEDGHLLKSPSQKQPYPPITAEDVSEDLRQDSKHWNPPAWLRDLLRIALWIFLVLMIIFATIILSADLIGCITLERTTEIAIVWPPQLPLGATTPLFQALFAGFAGVYFLALGYGYVHWSVRLKPTQARGEWVEKTRNALRSWSRSERLEFVTHVANPESPNRDWKMGVCGTTFVLYSVVLLEWVFLLTQAVVCVSGWWALYYFVVAFYAIYVPMNFGWHFSRVVLARRIRRRCAGLEVWKRGEDGEKGLLVEKMGGEREQLAWFIEGVLHEDELSEEANADMEKYVIFPIIELIRTEDDLARGIASRD